MPLKTPEYLAPGDKIAIVATARKISSEEIQAAVTVFKAWGLEVVKGSTIDRVYNQFAGDDEQRLEDFQNALDNVEIKAIICARGGYGTLRILDGLDFSRFNANPKWIVGFSDITVLHSHIQRVCEVESIHALMPVNFPGMQLHHPSISTLKRALFGEKVSIVNEFEFPALLTKNRSGEASGILTGGNLSLLYALQGSISDIQTENKILFIEDLDEYLYHIDRMVLSLKRSGKLSKLAALIVGGMTDMKDNTVPFGKTAEEIIMEHVQEFDYPVVFGFPAGHVSDNRALIMGRNVHLKVSDSKVDLEFL